MEKDQKGPTGRHARLIRTLDNKRTVSSQQSNYPRHFHGRKFTMQNQQTKKKIRGTVISRKNQSLPKALSTINNCNTNRQIKSRRAGSNLHIKINNEQSSSSKQKQITVELSQYVDRHGNKLSDVFIKALKAYEQQKYSECASILQQISQKIDNKCNKINYYKGLCYYEQGKTDKAIFLLSKVLENGFQFDGKGLYSLAEAYEKTRNYICALKTLDQCLKTFKSSRAYLMRARINFSFKQYQKAIKDYTSCYQLDPYQLEAYIEEAQAIYKLHGLDKAIEKYNNLLVNYKSLWPESKYMDINYVKYKKSLLLLQQKKYTLALNLLSQVTNSELQSQTNYYRGIIYSLLANYEQALVSFSKSIQANTSIKFVSQSYYQKFVIMFKRSQFYAIQHELDLIGSQLTGNEGLNMMSKVVQGIILILKMNFKQGIQELTLSLSQNRWYQHNTKIFKTTIVSFKAFAYYSLQEFDNALAQLESIKTKGFSQSNQYNYIMLQGINNAIKFQFNAAIKNYQKAQNIQPFNSHTSMVKAITQIMLFRNLQKKQRHNSLQISNKETTNVFNEKINNAKTIKKKIPKKEGRRSSVQLYNEMQQQSLTNKQILLSAEELLNRCLLKQNENDQLLYIIAVLHYELDQCQTGLKFIRKAIEVSDDHMIKHYYVKANLKIMSNMVVEAISDYTNAILVMNEQLQAHEQENKQQLIQQIYLQRAKCYILTGAKSKAQADLKRFFTQLENVKQYENQLDLFMHVGCADIILDIYKTILNKQYQLYNKMKCYYLVKQLNNCLTIMNALLDFQEQESIEEGSFNLNQLSVDRDCLQALRKSSQGSEIFLKDALQSFEKVIQTNYFGAIFTKADCLFYAGMLCFCLDKYSEAKNYFIDSKSQKIVNNQMENIQQSMDCFENRIYCLEQINYNIGICDYAQGKWCTYLDSFSQFKQHHQAVTENLLQSPENITPFPIKNRLCSIYSAKKTGNVQYNLSFCLPKLNIRQVSFQKNPKILSRISLKDIDMRPSAPWIQKNKKGIVFTNQIAKESIDLKSQKSRTKNKKGQNRYRDLVSG